MEKIKSLADLKRIKENVQTKIDLREKSEQVENLDRKSTRLNSSHITRYRMPSSA